MDHYNVLYLVVTMKKVLEAGVGFPPKSMHIEWNKLAGAYQSMPFSFFLFLTQYQKFSEARIGICDWG